MLSPSEEAKMLLHLPIAIVATFSPITVSDQVPKFDIVKECRFESESPRAFTRCSHDETDTLQKLKLEWPQFAAPDKRSCLTEATIGGFASYVDFLICLEMARDARGEKTNPGGSFGTMPPAPPEVSVIDKNE
jgi:hypothetical protein